jgi:hypothetical protein
MIRLWAPTIVLVLGIELVVSPIFAGGVAPSAATAAQRDEAQGHFARGRSLHGQRKFEEALAAFRAAHAIVASPNARLYASRCLRELDRKTEAWTELVETEAEAKALAAADPKYAQAAEAAEAERLEVEQEIGLVTIDVVGASDATRVRVGGGEPRAARDRLVAPVRPGVTEIEVETPGRPRVTRSISVEAGARTSVEILADAPSPTTTTTSDRSTGGDLRTWSYVAGGIGAAGLATFAIFGALAADRYATLRDECGGPCPPSRRDDVEGGRDRQTIANVGLVVGVIGIATGVGLFALSLRGTKDAGSKEARTTDVQVVARPAFVGLEGTF